ncbi:MAG: dipicolinate synthase subunit DpsA [Christensenellales bacterium]
MLSILIAGGDTRQIVLSKLFQEKGYDVYITGFDKLGIKDEAKNNPDYVFLPVPYKSEAGFLKTPFSSERIALADIVNAHPNSVYVLGGCDNVANKIFGNLIRYIDLFQNEAFLVRNALLTAQGAICAYLKNTDKALCDSICVVVGYGRISKFLCRLLKAFSAKVIAAARKERDFELIRSEQMHAAHINDLRNIISDADVIFNTVPCQIIQEEELKNIKQGAKVIELASPPFGMDIELAKNMGVDVQLESGLPGRYFPVSAANAMLHAFEREEL